MLLKRELLKTWVCLCLIEQFICRFFCRNQQFETAPPFSFKKIKTGIENLRRGFKSRYGFSQLPSSLETVFLFFFFFSVCPGERPLPNDHCSWLNSTLIQLTVLIR